MAATSFIVDDEEFWRATWIDVGELCEDGGEVPHAMLQVALVQHSSSIFLKLSNLQAKTIDSLCNWKKPFSVPIKSL